MKQKMNNFIVCMLLFLGVVCAAQEEKVNPKLLECKEKAPDIEAFLKKPNAQNIMNLSRVFLKDSKPIAALAIVEFGLKNVPPDDLPQMEDTEKECLERLDFLKKRADSYWEKSQKAHDPSALCSVAAIYFYAGFTGRSMGLLQNTMTKTGEMSEAGGLYNNLLNDLKLTVDAYSELYKELEQLCADQKKDEAIVVLSKMIYIGIHSGEKLDCIETFKKTFKDKNLDAPLTVFEDMPQKIIFQQNQWRKLW